MVQSAGLQSYLQYETMLLCGKVSVDIGKWSHELKSASLALPNTILEVRCLFPQVEHLIRLMLLCPATSCSAERSFSALRRLKTWLRSTITQPRLNAEAVCHVDQDIMDSLDIKKLREEFAG
jgi:hAT family C-terminal dimerisation region